ncbi:MAG: UDP-N-acetylglucosamine--N-acetylmuramyl-(pentapeptide) pyrophosphoryl-undecaprenol N-acetylglucosamine transferase [Lentisphaerae bacterium]|nr:UDP-N-acetylglucosamine--N-acetylmuramyl-(pentapeptide) pyrophosphoryl-undecaprenol N-acetylglucosamine transferase [Lentisphaerota bacterium]
MLDNHRCRHLAIACGGTGGHFYPTLAVAKEYTLRGGKVTLLVSGRHAEAQMDIARSYNFDVVKTNAVRSPESLLQYFTYPGKLWQCVREVRKVLLSLEPSVLLGMGSFAAVPACLALPRQQLPLVLHEGNAFMGKANRMLSRKASAIGLSLPLADRRQLHGCYAEMVGMPLREAIVLASEMPAPSEYFLPSLGLDSSRKTVLVFGGSQGAKAINELFRDSAARFSPWKDHLQFLHLTGTDDNDALQAAYKSAGVPASIRRSDASIENCYRAADLVICRAGASSICELALFGKPVILIPLPTSADDHQRINAETLVKAGAAKYFPQAQANPDTLMACLQDWMDNPAPWQTMGEKLKTMARPRAAATLTDLLEKFSA